MNHKGGKSQVAHKLTKEQIVESVPQKGFLDIQEDCSHCFSLNFGSGFPTME